MKTAVSIIDDNLALLTSLSLSLNSHGYHTITFNCPKKALEHHTQHPADFYIIDMKMPILNGIEFYQTLCLKLNVDRLPAVILTAAEEEEARCLTKTTIADFIKKPFNLNGLIARMNKILISLKGLSTNKPYKIGNLKIYEDKIMCSWYNNQIELTKKELILLSSLAHRPRVVFSRGKLLEICYSDNMEVNDRVIDSHIKRLRCKFRKVHPEKKFNRIKTYYSSGYSWQPQNIANTQNNS